MRWGGTTTYTSSRTAKYVFPKVEVGVNCLENCSFPKGKKGLA